VERALVGLALGGPAAVTAYALMRAVERAFFLEPNPAMLIWSDQSPFAWRALIAAHAGAMTAFGGYALASRSPRAAARWLTGAIALATLAITAQAALAP
jgi:hypothetical protein